MFLEFHLDYGPVHRNRLPNTYQRPIFWHDIPFWIAAGENLTRTAVFVSPLLMPLHIGRSRHSLGLTVYTFGLLVYLLAWMMQIWYPKTQWSAGRAGFMAPAYTPLVWLAGIGLTGDSLYAGGVYRSWMYLALSAVFLGFHNAHAWIVYSRHHARFIDPQAAH